MYKQLSSLLKEKANVDAQIRALRIQDVRSSVVVVEQLYPTHNDLHKMQAAYKELEKQLYKPYQVYSLIDEQLDILDDLFELFQ